MKNVPHFHSFCFSKTESFGNVPNKVFIILLIYFQTNISTAILTLPARSSIFRNNFLIGRTKLSRRSANDRCLSFLFNSFYFKHMRRRTASILGGEETNIDSINNVSLSLSVSVIKHLMQFIGRNVSPRAKMLCRS